MNSLNSIGYWCTFHWLFHKTYLFAVLIHISLVISYFKGAIYLFIYMKHHHGLMIIEVKSLSHDPNCLWSPITRTFHLICQFSFLKIIFLVKALTDFLWIQFLYEYAEIGFCFIFHSQDNLLFPNCFVIKWNNWISKNISCNCFRPIDLKFIGFETNKITLLRVADFHSYCFCWSEWSMPVFCKQKLRTKIHNLNVICICNTFVSGKHTDIM
jgi:hypothetical protein